MFLVPVFTLETNNQKNNEFLPKSIQTDNASSNLKAAIVFTLIAWGQTLKAGRVLNW